jgi:hypothetical protein
MEDEDLEARAQAAQDAVKGKALYLNLGELLDEQYFRGLVLGLLIGSVAALAWLMLREEHE